MANTKNNIKTERTPEEKKQIALVVIMAVVALVLLIVSSKAFFATDERDFTATQTTSGQEITTSVSLQQTTSEPSTSQSTSKPTVSQNNNEMSTTQKTTEKENLSKDEILKKVSDGINSLKAPNASYKGFKSQVIDIKLTDCSVPAATNPINKVLELFMGEEKYEYDFTNGVAKNPEEKGDITTDEAIPPSFKAFALTVDGVKNAHVEKDGENTVYTVELITEDSRLGEVPPNHSVACDIIKLEELNIPAEITKADYTYSGTTISVTYNKEGKVIRYHEYFDMYGVGEGHALGVTASCTMEGYIDEVWDISWK